MWGRHGGTLWQRVEVPARVEMERKREERDRWRYSIMVVYGLHRREERSPWSAQSRGARQADVARRRVDPHVCGPALVPHRTYPRLAGLLHLVGASHVGQRCGCSRDSVLGGALLCVNLPAGRLLCRIWRSADTGPGRQAVRIPPPRFEADLGHAQRHCAVRCCRKRACDGSLVRC
eukprot:scaffold1576_cov102-Isochrysis_galbana.AAC.6